MLSVIKMPIMQKATPVCSSESETTVTKRYHPILTDDGDERM